MYTNNGPSKVVDEVASPDENMRVMTEKELASFRKNIRDFYRTLCQRTIGDGE